MSQETWNKVEGEPVEPLTEDELEKVLAIGPIGHGEISGVITFMREEIGTEKTLGNARDTLTMLWRDEGKDGRKKYLGRSLHALIKLIEKYTSADLTIDEVSKAETKVMQEFFGNAAYPENEKAAPSEEKKAA